MTLRNIILPLLFACICCGCSDDNNMPGGETGQPTTKNVIVDTDLGKCTDDALAWQILFKYQAEKKCNVLGVMQDWKVEKGKVLADCFLHYYKADNVPLGLVDGEEPIFEIVPYFQLVDSTYQDGTYWFPRTGIPQSERLEAWKLYRKLLSQAADHSVYIICIGAFTNLGLLLQSQPDEYSPLSGADLVALKVKQLDLTGGCFTKVKSKFNDEYIDKEYNIALDVPLAKAVLDKWPTPLNLLPLEEGMKFISNHDEVLADYAWNPTSPMYRIYSHYNEQAVGDVGQYWWDALTVMHTIEPDKFFSCSKQGTLSISNQGMTTFEQAPNGNAHIISVDSLHTKAVHEFMRLASKWKP